MNCSIGIIIPVFNNLNYTKQCLQNLDTILTSDENRAKCYTIIVIDDGSTDGTGEWVKMHYPKVHLLMGDGNLWWSGGINVGAKFAIEELACDYILLWNNDIQVDPGYFNVIMEVVNKYDGNTIIGSKIYANPEKTIVWSMGGIFNPKTGNSEMIGYKTKDSAEYKNIQDVDWLTGMGTLVPSKVIKQIGYWDQVHFPQYFGDTEFTYRAKINGFKNIVIPDLVIWNDISNSGLRHEGSVKKMLKMLNDKRSLYNIRANLHFYRLYSESTLAYFNLFKKYWIFFGSFMKWKTLGFFGIKKQTTL